MSLVCQGFADYGSNVAAGLGLRNLPVSVYPGQVNIDTIDKLQKNVETAVVDGVIQALTTQPEEAEQATEPGPKDIVFTGDFEQVNRFFCENEWSDGLPVVPPSIQKGRNQKFRDVILPVDISSPTGYVESGEAPANIGGYCFRLVCIEGGFADEKSSCD